ncbi:MAG: helix-turn-helix domain-containing protein [Phascolarctobacterium succinatutens]|uniref:helix-turn-helix transcriptional regulator n=1 Tax=Phascolarctobacterium succinatutens TaxID=626940 RepID=UPI0023F02C18|nr:helix-turn-helix domain-containing protein [Phascolarctobacterium succinatutens]MCI6544399.1 helix-turn-helix domain-containing protein [Phascolarctobacterium succinatutens]
MGISENIKLLREQYGLSQKELGQIAGVSDKAVSTWEQGIKEPRMGAIQKIADHFGIQKSNIIEDNGLQSQSVSLTPRDERQIAADLEKMLADLDSKNAMAAMGGTVEDDEDRELLKASLQATMRLAKKIAKEKYTPKKYRHEEE